MKGKSVVIKTEGLRRGDTLTLLGLLITVESKRRQRGKDGKLWPVFRLQIQEIAHEKA